jgi:transcriptional regulator with XRE-family HTH domain
MPLSQEGVNIMTASLLAEFGHPVQTKRTDIARSSRAATSSRPGSHTSPSWGGLRAALTRSPSPAGVQADETLLPGSAPGVIGGAIIRAARKSARMSRRKLANMLSVSPDTVRSWEDGTCALFCVPYADLRRLAATLDQAGAKVRCDVAELVLASQCDLLVTGILQGFEDYAEVPPVDEDSTEGDAARDLLRWALVGVLPERFRPFAPARPLLAAQDLTAFTALAERLSASPHNDQLARYGRALTAFWVG